MEMKLKIMIVFAITGICLCMPLSAMAGDETDPMYKDNPYINKLQQGASNACVWIDRYLHPDGDDVIKKALLVKDGLAETQKNCAKVADDALASGIPAEVLVDFNTYKSSITAPLPLGEIKDKVCMAAINYLQGGNKQHQGAKDAKQSPFLKVLSGDKKRIFLERGMGLGGEIIYGHGGKELIITAGHDRNRLIPAWSVGGWRFKGDKLVGTVDKSGTGESIPASAFK
ncbi:MAG: hypothetical protein HY279_02500 [Nitrospinae bacterium]|nr:hypothetical protein [Nitrospinota bacterium]